MDDDDDEEESTKFLEEKVGSYGDELEDSESTCTHGSHRDSRSGPRGGKPTSAPAEQDWTEVAELLATNPAILGLSLIHI